MLRWIGGWAVAVLLAYAVGSVLMTQVVIADLARLGVSVDLGTRLSMSASDLAGLATSYLPLLAIALLVAFLLATLLSRFTTAKRALRILAGASGVLCLLLIMQQVLGLNPLAGTRGLGGHGLQTLAGTLGGWLFAVLTVPGNGNSSEPTH